MAASPTPAARRIHRLVVLGGAVVAVALVRDRLIASAERREATRLGIDSTP